MLAVAGIAYRYEGETRYYQQASFGSRKRAGAELVREGITNVIRHSAAHHCVIHMERDENSIRVEVVDDGKEAPYPARAMSQAQVWV